MSPRVKGSTMRPVVSRSRAEREAEIRAHVASGMQLPSAIAKAMGCSKELVMLYAKQMPEIEIHRMRHQGERMQNVLYLASQLCEAGPGA